MLAGLKSGSGLLLEDAESAAVSWPTFWNDVQGMM